jgi:hypothetical protein
LRPEILWTDDFCNLLDVIVWDEASSEDEEDEIEIDPEWKEIID